MDGTVASVIVIAYRILVPLTMFRWPLAGIFIADVADASDAIVFEKTGWGLFSGDHGYTEWDKALDLWYLFIALLAARKFWTEPLARKTAHWLFGWRALGVLAFYFWPHRILFVLAPSIWENFYILWTAIRKWWPSVAKTLEGAPLKFAGLLVLVAIPKIAQEIMMHWIFEDRTWIFFRTYVFFWLY